MHKGTKSRSCTQWDRALVEVTPPCYLGRFLQIHGYKEVVTRGIALVPAMNHALKPLRGVALWGPRKVPDFLTKDSIVCLNKG